MSVLSKEVRLRKSCRHYWCSVVLVAEPATLASELTDNRGKDLASDPRVSGTGCRALAF